MYVFLFPSRPSTHALLKCLECYKTTVFAMFYTHRMPHARNWKRAKFDAGACRTELSAQVVLKIRLGAHRTRFCRGLGLSWEALGPHLAGVWAFLGSSRAPLAGAWAALGSFLGACGSPLPCQERLWVEICLPRTPRTSILARLGTCWAGF